ncbi:hypothetical protein [Cytobacillus firmus]|uniref:hypothetical protein n=1 Tax=Cytobacillus firmus TaxID=1399 RepID=UPI0018CEC7CC|nr:hypothetical protein [Cytobacillus firmus]MBG9654308.1 hypothetical protein [Cytobacillus firmus]MED1905710.1 hypothetical protein [Cytobacillus firmus]
MEDIHKRRFIKRSWQPLSPSLPDFGLQEAFMVIVFRFASYFSASFRLFSRHLLLNLPGFSTLIETISPELKQKRKTFKDPVESFLFSGLTAT